MSIELFAVVGWRALLNALSSVPLRKFAEKATQHYSTFNILKDLPQAKCLATLEWLLTRFIE